jgi:hypothetical protein
MVTEYRTIVALKAFLVVLFGILVVFQTLSLPGQFAHMAKESPDLAHLRWPLTAVAVFWVVCMQVVIVCTWKLLTLVRHERIFSDASFAWVNAILGAVGAAWLTLLGVWTYVAFTWTDPGLPLLLLLMLVGVAVLGLLMAVMRALLRQATTLRTDMQAVI